MQSLVPYTMYTEGGEMDGGKYRTKRANTKKKAKNAFIKSLVKKGYSEQYAKMAFGKEEKNKRELKSTRNWNGKKGGMYRTKKTGDDVEKARIAFVKSLMGKKVPYTEKGAKMLFSKEEKLDRILKSTRGFQKGKRKLKKKEKTGEVPEQLRPWSAFLKMHPYKKAKAEDPKLSYQEYLETMSEAFHEPEKKKV